MMLQNMHADNYNKTRHSPTHTNTTTQPCKHYNTLIQTLKHNHTTHTQVSVMYTDNGASFSRLGSFKQTSLTERLTDPQSAIVAGLCDCVCFIIIMTSPITNQPLQSQCQPSRPRTHMPCRDLELPWRS